MPDRPWKVQERSAAKVLGGERAVCSGSNLPDKTDVRFVKINGIPIAVQCKYAAKMKVASLYREAKANARKTKSIPLLLLKEKGMQGQLVVIHIDDLAVLTNARTEDIKDLVTTKEDE
jgi:hypothetical protein